MTPKKYRQIVSTQIAAILKAEREKRGLSMTVVAQRAGLSQQIISYVERELRSPTLDTLLRISYGIGVDLAEVARQAEAKAKRLE